MIQTNIIPTAYKTGVKKLVFLGSSCFYPKYPEIPITEDQLMTSALEPSNDAYAIAKIAGIKMCQSYRDQYGFNAICLMPTNLYGPNDNFDLESSHVFPAMIRKLDDAKNNNAVYPDGDKEWTPPVVLWVDGSPMREFLHVDDLGNACVFCLENWCPSSNELSYLNVGTGIDLSIQKLAEMVADATGFRGEILWDSTKPNGIYKKQLDVSRLNKIGWYPSITLAEGLPKTVARFREEIDQKLARF